MNNPNMTLAQIRQIGLAVLARHLGPVGMVRFLQHSETGHGNYTEERHQWLENKDVKDLAAQIIARRGQPGGREDYTADRHQWLGDPPLEKVVAEIQANYPGPSTSQ